MSVILILHVHVLDPVSGCLDPLPLDVRNGNVISLVAFGLWLISSIALCSVMLLPYGLGPPPMEPEISHAEAILAVIAHNSAARIESSMVVGGRG